MCSQVSVPEQVGKHISWALLVATVSLTDIGYAIEWLDRKEKGVVLWKK